MLHPDLDISRITFQPQVIGYVVAQKLLKQKEIYYLWNFHGSIEPKLVLNDGDMHWGNPKSLGSALCVSCYSNVSIDPKSVVIFLLFCSLYCDLLLCLTLSCLRTYLTLMV